MERIGPRRRRVSMLVLGSNPLRREVDRIEASIFAGLLVAFLIGAPLLALGAGWWEHGAAAAEQRAQRSVHLVTAVLLQDVPDIVVGTGAWDAGALARWAAPDGKSRVGLVLDTAGAKAGSRLRIWVDGSGRQAYPPLTGHGVRARVITAAALASAAFAVMLLTVAAGLRWLLNRRRLAGWGAAWAEVGPRWTRHELPGLPHRGHVRASHEGSRCCQWGGSIASPVGVIRFVGGRRGREEHDMSVYRVIEVIGTSGTSWEDAAAEAVKTAAGTIRDLRVAEVVKQDLHLEENGAITYRTKLQLSFKYERER
jgi:flavin-binding protein dodecin